MEGRETVSSPVLVAQAVVTAQAQQGIPVRILNPGKGEVTLYSGSRVAVASSVEASQVVECSDQECRGVLSISRELEGDLWHTVERVGEQLTTEQREVLYAFLESYADIFASSPDDFGRNAQVQHQINTGDARPIRQRIRRIPPARRQEVSQLLQDMRCKGIIQPSTSPWASPIVLVQKKDGSIRFCVDYRELNSVTRKDAYPLPRIDDMLDTLAGAKWFSTLDLLSGYWQVEMDEADKPKTAFCTPEGLFEFNVMPFGLCNAPATFQRLMDSVLAGLQWSSCLVYLDDIIVMDKTFEDHLRNLAEVFDCLRSANLKLKPTKCAFACKEVAFLGHIVSDQGVATNPALTEKVSNWPEPQSVREVQQFLGLASYYRRFVQDYAQIAKPLHRLTEKSCSFRWSAECASAFQELRQRLVSAPILAFPDFNQPFI
ncbi:MAG: RNA-directed DNA polymerase, partial [Alphaproteobacteria bacterium]|nr:RNA-directed DNA polymerase [Alphaproteobacteria bacterium]